LADIKQFRRDVAVLKKQGLLPPKIDGPKGGKNRRVLDARKALPSWKVKGKTLASIIKKYDDVTSGKLTAVKVTPKELKQFRKSGFETSQGRVLVPHTKGEIVKLKKGQVSITNKSGMERVQIPIEFHNLPQYFRDIRKNSALINAMKMNNEYFGIRFFGGQRANFYSDILALQADLEAYESIQQAIRKEIPDGHEIYHNLEIVKLNRSGALKVESQVEQRKKIMSREYNRLRAKRVYERRKQKGPGVMAEFRHKKAQSEKERRARIRRDPRAYARYKSAAKKRQQKSWNKKRKKKVSKRKK
jgi:hypothetical protein